MKIRGQISFKMAEGGGGVVLSIVFCFDDENVFDPAVVPGDALETPKKNAVWNRWERYMPFGHVCIGVRRAIEGESPVRVRATIYNADQDISARAQTYVRTVFGLKDDAELDVEWSICIRARDDYPAFAPDVNEFEDGTKCTVCHLPDQRLLLFSDAYTGLTQCLMRHKRPDEIINM